MDNSNSRIIFNTLNRHEWLQIISRAKQMCDKGKYAENILIVYNGVFNKNKKEPFHIVTLACLVQHCSNRGHKVFLDSENKEFFDLLFEELRFREYFSNARNSVEYHEKEVYDLWRIVDNEKEVYPTHVVNYFKREFFRGRDLSALKECITEVYYNIFDHARANNNAFSMIEYNKNAETIDIAICDFGIGIAQSVRAFCPDIIDDEIALSQAVEYNFTVKSRRHNQGKGLDTILASSETARIFSNGALLVKAGSQIKTLQTPFSFEGTLLYLTISLKDLCEDDIIIEEFTI